MLSKELNEKLNIWTNELNDIKEKINNLNEDKITGKYYKKRTGRIDK